MIRRFAIACTVFSVLTVPLAARAADATTVLDVHHAGCVLCGPIVKTTLKRVKGVKSVRVSQLNGEADVMATVTYDNARTGTAALIRAVTNRGYPAAVAKTGQG
jgi:mercuric ion binding protein